MAFSPPADFGFFGASGFGFFAGGGVAVGLTCTFGPPCAVTVTPTEDGDAAGRRDGEVAVDVDVARAERVLELVVLDDLVELARGLHVEELLALRVVEARR
jgi:hypothetical protein